MARTTKANDVQQLQCTATRPAAAMRCCRRHGGGTAVAAAAATTDRPLATTVLLCHSPAAGVTTARKPAFQPALSLLLALRCCCLLTADCRLSLSLAGSAHCSRCSPSTAGHRLQGVQCQYRNSQAGSTLCHAAKPMPPATLKMRPHLPRHSHPLHTSLAATLWWAW